MGEPLEEITLLNQQVPVAMRRAREAGNALSNTLKARRGWKTKRRRSRSTHAMIAALFPSKIHAVARHSQPRQTLAQTADAAKSACGAMPASRDVQEPYDECV